MRHIHSSALLGKSVFKSNVLLSTAYNVSLPLCLPGHFRHGVLRPGPRHAKLGKRRVKGDLVLQRIADSMTAFYSPHNHGKCKQQAQHYTTEREHAFARVCVATSGTGYGWDVNCAPQYTSRCRTGR